MTLMSWADLSYILPITAIGYVLSAIAGQTLPRRADLTDALERDALDCRGNRTRRPHAGGDPLMRWLLVGAIVASTTVGDLLQSFEMKQHKQSSLAKTVGFLHRPCCC